jgi:hypothetical protein
MLDPKQIADLDQATAAMSEAIPTMLWGFYSGLLAKGFTVEQAITLTATYLNALAMNAKR